MTADTEKLIIKQLAGIDTRLEAIELLLARLCR